MTNIIPIQRGQRGPRGPDIVHFDVPGKPVPQGSKTQAKANGRTWLRESNADALRVWRDAIIFYARRECVTRQTITDPVIVTAIFHILQPASVSRLVPSVKPDLDKLQRALGDGLTEARVIRDDALIVEWHAYKSYVPLSNASPFCGVCVSVETWEGQIPPTPTNHHLPVKEPV